MKCAKIPLAQTDDIPVTGYLHILRAADYVAPNDFFRYAGVVYGINNPVPMLLIWNDRVIMLNSQNICLVIEVFLLDP